MSDEIKNTTKHHAYDTNDLDKLGPWLNDMGIKYNATRYGTSTKIFKKWIENGNTPSFRELWGINELFELMEFYYSFNPPSEDTKKLLHLIKAGDSVLEKSKTSSARDYAFELKVASRFKRAGFEIINDNSHDVVAKKDEVKLYIECKRPRNEKRVIERMRNAYDRQFTDVNNKLEQAIICLDLSNILYEDFTNSFRDRGSENISTNMDFLSKYRDATDLRFKRMIESKAPDIAYGCRMIILFYSFPVFLETSPSSGIEHFVQFNHFSRLVNRKDNIDEIISVALKSSLGSLANNLSK